jgi:hypothetical protein
MGFNRLLFFSPACGVHLQGEKSDPNTKNLPSVPIFRRVCLSLCPSFLCSLITDNKKHGLLWVVSFGWLLFSPIEQIRTLQAGCRFGLLPLSCPCLFAVLLPWGLRCSTGWHYLLPRCGSCNNMLLLCLFSWCIGCYPDTIILPASTLYSMPATL